MVLPCSDGGYDNNFLPNYSHTPGLYYALLQVENFCFLFIENYEHDMKTLSWWTWNRHSGIIQDSSVRTG